MSQPTSTPAATVKYATPASVAVDIILVVAFFFYMSWVLRSHVPSEDEFYITLWSMLGSACMSGVFWLCIQMFRVVLRAQREAQGKH